MDARYRQGQPLLGCLIDTGSGAGFCAEHSAIAAMVTAGEYRIAKIVAVWQNDEGVVHVLSPSPSPCGRCRAFIQQVDPANLDTEVVLSPHRSARLRELLPSTSGHIHSTDEDQACWTVATVGAMAVGTLLRLEGDDQPPPLGIATATSL